MWVDVKIPYEPDHRLAYAYNRAVSETTAPWVLILDQDVTLVNPHWYEMCLEAVKQVPDAGLITCVMNGCSDRPQRPDCEITKSPDRTVHEAKALEVYKKHGSKLIEVTDDRIAGYFMLVNCAVWKKLAFSDDDGRYKVDQNFCRRLLKRGYKIYLMPGLYVYHRRGMRKLNWK